VKERKERMSRGQHEGRTLEDGRSNARKSDELTLSRGEVLSAGLVRKEECESAEEEHRRRPRNDGRATHGDRRVEIDRVSSRSSGSIRGARLLESSKSRRLQGRVEDSIVVLRVRVDVKSNGAAEREEPLGEGQYGARKAELEES
jgi:hypothetical protein